jgi:hypothetical protein
MAKYRQSEKKDYSWLWGIAIIGALFFLAESCSGGVSGASGPSFPFDDSYQDNADTAQEYWEGRQEIERIENDPCTQDIMNGVPPEYQRCDNKSSSQGYSNDETTSSDSQDECPFGCTYHKAGCDIKGNVSFNTGEKIYHVPGSEFYAATVINPDYGERWFCTQADAITNGWRKSSK